MLARSYAGIALAVGLALAPGCKKESEKLPPARGEGAPPPASMPVIAATPKDTGPRDGRTTGTTFPAAESNVGPLQSGTIATVDVVEGQKVKKGDVLFHMDGRDASLRAKQAEVALQQAEIAARASQTEYDRTKALVDQGAQNRAAWDAVVARNDGAKVGVEQAKVMLAMARKASSDMVVRAPFDGVIVAKLKNSGELATTMPPTVVVVVQDQRSLELKFRLPELSLKGVAVGMPVKATFTAIGVTRDAKVSRITPAVDPRSRTVELVAVIPNDDGALKPGLLAEVEVKAP